MNKAEPLKPKAARDLVARCCAVFPRVPPSMALALMEIESSFRPDAHAKPAKATTAADVANSGAWGLLQVLQPTAVDMVRKLRRLNVEREEGLPPEVMKVVDRWDPARPACLLDAELGALVGVAYLDRLVEVFGAGLAKVAIAYHNGAGFLRGFLEEGQHIPGDLPPKGKEYLARALKAWPKYQDADPVIGPELT